MRVKKLIVDEKNKLFNDKGMEHLEFPSNFNQIRKYTFEIIKNAPKKFKEINLLEQQLSELIKNAIEHGNKNDKKKKVQVWYKFDIKKKTAHIIVEDEGDGFKNLEDWNEFYRKRTHYIEKQDFNNMLKYINYKTKTSTELDGGNAMFAAIEYWDGGIVYNNKKNKVAVLRHFK